MGNQKLTELTELTTLSPSDVTYVIDDPDGAPFSRKMRLDNVIKAGMGIASTAQYEKREVLYDETLSAQGVFDVSGLDQGYTDLELEVTMRTTASATSDNMKMYFNNDTDDNHYYRSYFLSNDGVANTGKGTGAYLGGRVPGNTSLSATFVIGIVKVPNYSTAGTYRKHIKYDFAVYNAAAATAVGTTFYAWSEADAINRIAIQPDGYPTDDFSHNSRLKITGIKSSG